MLGTTKPQLPTAAKFVYPRQAQIVPSPAVGTPLVIKMLASGLVYDAEYAWRAFVNGGAAAGPSRRACPAFRTRFAHVQLDLAVERATLCVHDGNTSTLTCTLTRTASPATTLQHP